MAVNLIERLLSEAVQTGGTYAEFVVSENKIAFICDGGSRRSTINYRQTKAEMKADELTLRTVSEKSLLFSGQLKRIKITFSSGRTAVFHKTEHHNITTITARKANEIKEKIFEYVCFTSDNSPHTGVAFALKQLKNGRYQITPCAGAVMNGPNTTDYPTDLHFVISGGFSLKSESQDFNNGETDQEAAENLSVIMEYALRRILLLGLSGMPLFSVLPNSMDEDSFINTKLIQAIKNVCNNYPVFKNREGMIVNRSKIAFGTEEVTKLFPQVIAEPVLGNRYWIEPCKAGSREECFLKDIGIPYYDRNRFLKEFFRKENLDDCEGF